MAANDTPENVLFRVYERYIGEPERETDVYLGFGLFFLAVGFGILALVLTVFAFTVEGGHGSDEYLQIAPYGYVLAMFSLPMAMLSIVVLLPVKRRATITASAGVAVVAVGAVRFWHHYPAWGPWGENQTIEVLALYAAGMIVVLASTGAALVAHQLERVRAPVPSDIEDRDAETEDEEAETISDDEIEADIEEAMADVDLTWGGVESTENRELSLNTDFADEAIQAGSIDVEAQTRVETGGVDEQVQGLRNMKGGDTKTATSESTVDDQTAALNELKQQKESDQVPDNAPTANRGLLGRMLDRVGLS